MTRERINEIIELINKEVKPALGCTEPIAVSLAVASSCEVLRKNGFEPHHLVVNVSANILKNGMGVGIPGTGMVGLHIAAALAVFCGKSEYKLEVLKDLDADSIAKAKKMVDAGKVKIGLATDPAKLYVEALAYSEDEKNVAFSAIRDSHDDIVSVKFNDKELLGSGSAANAAGDDHSHKTTLDYKLTVKEILEFAKTAPFEDIKFILEAAHLNETLSKEGMKGDYGLKVGKTIMNSSLNNVFGSSIMTYAMAATAAASDARMAGCTLPAMSNSGSGNQGITVTMPVVAVARKMEKNDEELCRALILSHLIAIHIKGYLGKLSALCGCVIASTGSSCGIVYLNGGGYKELEAAIKNMIGNLSGMICDGAKVGCALKVATGVECSVQSAMLALQGISITENDGIIEKDLEKTIYNLGQIGSVGMQTTDRMILDIMINKK